MSEIEDLAKQIADLRSLVADLTRTSRLPNSSITQAGDTADMSDVVAGAVDAPAALAGLQDRLDANEAAVAASNDAVAQAVADAEQARLDGVAAGELASEAADEAVANAEAANEAAAAAKDRADAAKATADAAGITAGSAASAAANAAATANVAQATANGKNQVTYSTSNPPANRTQDAAPTTGTNWGVGGANAAGGGAVDRADSPSNRAFRTTFASGVTGWFVTPNENNAVIPGETIKVSIWGIHSWAGQVARVTVQFKDSTGASLGYVNGVNTVIPANTGTIISWTGTVPSGASLAQAFYDTNGGVQPSNGDVAYVGAVTVGLATDKFGTRAGDIWFVRNSNGWLSAQYEWDGAAWQVRSLDSAILAYIDAGKITAGTISADRIGANSITAAKLATDSVTSNAILAGTIQAVDIASGTITGDRIAAATLTASLLMADTLTSREIGADAILARNIKAAVITGDKLVAATITGDKIAANTITAGNIKAGTITANEIAAGTITATQINLDTLNGKTITGAVYKSAASGQRIEISGTNLRVYDANNNWVGAIESDATGRVRIRQMYASTNFLFGAFNTSFGNTYDIGVDAGSSKLYAPGIYSGVFGVDRPSGPYLFAQSYSDSSGASGVQLRATYAEIDKVFSQGPVQADDFLLRTGKSIVRPQSTAGSGTYSGGSIAGNRGNVTVTVTFPTGMFSVPPTVLPSSGNSRIMTSVSSVTTTQAQILLLNYTDTTITSSVNYSWVAVANS